MRNIIKKTTSVILTACMALGVFTSSMLVGLAEQSTDAKTLEGTKTAEKIEKDKYGITVTVPGGDVENVHDEVIVMVDGSYSMDEEWEDMKKAIVAIGESVLDGTGATQLTLMSFGISPNVVLEHVKTVEELERTLPSKPGGLLYGRSATNCDGAFEGIENYLDMHDKTLKDAFVIFLSDGGANLNSEKVDWITVAGKISAKNALAVQQDEFNNVTLGNAVISEASKTVYGDDLDNMLAKWKFMFDSDAKLAELDAKLAELDTASEEYAAVKVEFDALLAESGEAYNYVLNKFKETDESGKTNAQKWVVEVYRDFYEFRGLTEGEKYPVYVAEYAYVDYQKENNYRLYNTFYYVLSLSGIAHDNVDGVKGYYAGEEAAKAALHEKIDQLYIVRYGYDHRSGWMTNVEGTTFVQSDSVSTLTQALAETLKELSKTPYNDVVITDYMSKWVNLDPSTLKIVDVTTGQVIWTAADGWLITEGRPTAQEVPVIVELIEKDGYAAGGPDVEGNISGDIYKLTWYVKDGALLRSDNYKLVYEVTVDTAENGFEYGVDYPANGETNITYTDETPKKVTVNIKVPNVTPEAPKKTTVSFESGEASNISFMLIDKATGKVTFLKKIDIGGETSFEIPTEEGYISAVFVKQSTSGMFWTSEEIDEETQNAVIKCLKANNPSYKGHWSEFFFGDGECTWEFKRGKKVTYTFSGAGAVINKDTSDVPVVEPEIEDTPVVEDTVVDIPVVEPEVVEPTLNYTLSGGSIKNWVVVDGVTAIYVEANGKIPAVIWTSEKVDDKAMNKIVKALGADADVKISGEGKHTVEYQQNKNKTKTVTYTFKKI